jgi:hypothetical protein
MPDPDPQRTIRWPVTGPNERRNRERTGHDCQPPPEPFTRDVQISPPHLAISPYSPYRKAVLILDP